MSAAPRHTARTAAYVLLVIAIAFYVPLSLSYFAFGTPTDNGRLQDHVLNFLISPAFAFGVGSGHGADGNFATFATTYSTMWIHSVLGTATLVCGASQFWTGLRVRHQRIHRTLGKVFILGCFAVAGSAAVYLTRTGQDRVFSGRVFNDELWMLALGTATAAALAYVAIRRKDLIAHREYVAIAFALICSAPALRVEWIVVGNLWPQSKEMINIVCTEFAAQVLVAGAIVFSSRYWKGTRGADSPLAGTQTLRGAAVLGAGGVVSLIVASTAVHWSDPHPDWFVTGWGPILIGGGLSWGLMTGWFALAARRAAVRGNLAARAAWRAYLAGSIAAPAVGAIGLAAAIKLQHVPTQQAWYLVPYVMGVWMVGVYTTQTTLASRWIHGRPSTIQDIREFDPHISSSPHMS